MQTSDTPTLKDLRADLECVNDRLVKVGARKSECQTRLPEIAKEIARAVANDDPTTAKTLRDQRKQMEEELRDIETAEQMLASEVEKADARLAKAEIPDLFAELRADCSRFVALISEANQLSTMIAVKRSRYGQRFTVAGRANAWSGDSQQTTAADPQSPNASVAMPPLAQRFYKDLADFN